MIMKTHLSVEEAANIMGLDHRKAWLRLRKMGALVALPGYKYRKHIPVKLLAKLDPDAYERVLTEARFWDGECIHPTGSRKPVDHGVWCECCGSIRDEEGWTPTVSYKKSDKM